MRQTLTQKIIHSSFQFKHWLALSLLFSLLLSVLLSWVLIFLSERSDFQELERQGNARLDLYAATIEQAKKRFNYLPFIMAQEPSVLELLELEGPSQIAIDEIVNKKLSQWRNESLAATLYIMDKNGLVRASSNWQEDGSFVGNNYRFRPYFQDAIMGKQGQFFAIGVTTGRPGLFLSRPIKQQRGMDSFDIIGVAVVKIDMTQLEHDWKQGGETILVSDPHGIIFLSSNPNWKYKSLRPLPAPIAKRLQEEKKYANQIIQPLTKQSSSSANGRPIIQIENANKELQKYLVHSRSLKGLNWELHYLSDLSHINASRDILVFIALLVASLISVLTLTWLNHMRHKLLLEQRVESRTYALNQTNQQLREAINRQQQAEEQLHLTHEELIQAEKLAALGKMSTGLVHEISQPLSAMQTFTASTKLLIERKAIDQALDNINDIEAMINRMTSIVSHLKSFAAKSKGQNSNVKISEVIDNALLLLQHRLAKANIDLKWDSKQNNISLQLDEIRLEQILINLLRNALDAIAERQQYEPNAKAELQISLSHDEHWLSIKIMDAGIGVAQEHLKQIFEPFYTTKAKGHGLGLGLSVSQDIARQLGGDLSAKANSPHGMIFKIILPIAEPK